MSTQPYCRVFYAGLVYGEYSITTRPSSHELPDGAFLYFRDNKGTADQPLYWFNKDLTPVLHDSEFSDVPKTLLMLNLILDS